MVEGKNDTWMSSVSTSFLNIMSLIGTQRQKSHFRAPRHNPEDTSQGLFMFEIPGCCHMNRPGKKVPGCVLDFSGAGLVVAVRQCWVEGNIRISHIITLGCHHQYGMCSFFSMMVTVMFQNAASLLWGFFVRPNWEAPAWETTEMGIPKTIYLYIFSNQNTACLLLICLVCHISLTLPHKSVLEHKCLDGWETWTNFFDSLFSLFCAALTWSIGDHCLLHI